MGKAGKRAAKTRSWKLPPRTPEWDVLDYSLWAKVQEKTAPPMPGAKHTKKTWAAKLRKAAHGLSATAVKKACGAMRKRIVATAKAKVSHIKVD